MDRRQKEEFVENMREAISQANLVVVTRQSGMSVGEASSLRAKAREANVQHKVVKNKLTKIAISDTEYAPLSEYLTGPTSLSFSADPIAAAKLVVNYTKDSDKLSVVGGVLDGQLLSADEIKNLASLPSLDELRGKMVGLLQAPAGQIARIVNSPAGQLARVFSAYGNKS